MERVRTGGFGCGTIFQSTTAGELTTIANFNDSTTGHFPFPPVLLENGSLYGLTLEGGTNGYGTAFEIGTGGFQVIANFDSTTRQPAPPLLLANDGNLYGTDCGAGSQFGGVFQITPSGTLTTVANFAPDGSTGEGCDSNGLTQGTDGNLYGVSGVGGARGQGVVYQVRLGLAAAPPIVASFQPASGGPGTTMEIRGQHLIRVKEVAFGGVAAKFKMGTPNVLRAVVPPGALSGPLTITTLTGSGWSSQSFTVTP